MEKSKLREISIKMASTGGCGEDTSLLDASCSNLLSDEKFPQNRVGVGSDAEGKAKLCEFSFKPTSNGGRGGQKGLLGASFLKQTLEKSLAKNLDDREGGAGFDRDGVAGFARESREGLPSKEFCDVSFKPTLNEGCTGDSQVEKEAEKLALLDPSKKFAD